MRGFHTPPLSNSFLVKITGTTTIAYAPGVTGYTFDEWWLDGHDATYKVKPSGRRAIFANPGVALVGTFAVGDFAIAAEGTGAANNLWELLPVLGADDNPEPTPSACNPCGWLLDRAALIESGKVFRVRVYGGQTGQRCGCVEDQGHDDEDPFIATYNADDDDWELLRNIVLCCGCASLRFDIPDPEDGTMTGQITVFRSCEDGTRTTYDLKFLGCCVNAEGNRLARFAAAGPKLCNGSDREECDPSFYIELECVDCPLTNAECEACNCESPPVLKIPDNAGFTGDHAAYRGPWYLQRDPENPCLYSVECGDIMVVATLTESGGNGTATVTYTGAPGGTVVYSFTEDGLLDCMTEKTLDRDSGDSEETPATIDVEPGMCIPVTTACTLCNIPIKKRLYAHFANGTGDAVALNGITVPVTHLSGTTWVSRCLQNLGGLGLKGNVINVVCLDPPGIFTVTMQASPCPPDEDDCDGKSTGWEGSNSTDTFECCPLSFSTTLSVVGNCVTLSGTIDVLVNDIP